MLNSLPLNTFPLPYLPRPESQRIPTRAEYSISSNTSSTSSATTAGLQLNLGLLYMAVPVPVNFYGKFP